MSQKYVLCIKEVLDQKVPTYGRGWDRSEEMRTKELTMKPRFKE